MEINPIQSPFPAGNAVQAATTATGAGFADLLGQAIGQLQGISANADAQVAAMATGEDVELHDVMMALEAESLANSFAVEVRNKAVEAYQEVFRMQI